MLYLPVILHFCHLFFAFSSLCQFFIAFIYISIVSHFVILHYWKLFTRLSGPILVKNNYHKITTKSENSQFWEVLINKIQPKKTTTNINIKNKNSILLCATNLI